MHENDWEHWQVQSSGRIESRDAITSGCQWLTERVWPVELDDELGNRATPEQSQMAMELLHLLWDRGPHCWLTQSWCDYIELDGMGGVSGAIRAEVIVSIESDMSIEWAGLGGPTADGGGVPDTLTSASGKHTDVMEAANAIARFWQDATYIPTEDERAFADMTAAYLKRYRPALEALARM